MTTHGFIIIAAAGIIAVCGYLKHIKRKMKFELEQFLLFVFSSSLVPTGLLFIIYIVIGKESFPIKELSIQLFYSGLAFIVIGVHRISVYIKD